MGSRKLKASMRHAFWRLHHGVSDSALYIRRICMKSFVSSRWRRKVIVTGRTACIILNQMAVNKEKQPGWRCSSTGSKVLLCGTREPETWRDWRLIAPRR